MLIALDFGLSRIGIARSEGILAEPLESLPNNEHFIQNLTQLLENEIPEKIIIGKPQNTKLEAQFTQFIQNIMQHFLTNVVIQEEDFSTKEAKNRLVSSGISKKKRQSDDNAMAACVILERYLENC